jgi:hypothetical protein
VLSAESPEGSPEALLAESQKGSSEALLAEPEPGRRRQVRRAQSPYGPAWAA